MHFLKGHGTENDFIVLPDEQALTPLSPGRVAALCSRHSGIGADGILRVVRAGELVRAQELCSLPEGLGAQDWFMDYRNADGSPAEMCGNGVRVFAHYLHSRGLVAAKKFPVGTRAGTKLVTVHKGDVMTGSVTVSMGQPRVLGLSTATLADGRTIAGLGVDMGNPHLACVLPDLTPESLADLDLRTAPIADAEFFPQGVNVEILTPLERPAEGEEGAVSATGLPIDGRIHMRVVERGVGETRSCGTGTVAAAVAAAADAELGEATIEVVVPGGRVIVRLSDGESFLTGPSAIVASGEIDEDWFDQLPDGTLEPAGGSV